MEELPGYIHIGEQKKELVWKRDSMSKGECQ